MRKSWVETLNVSLSATGAGVTDSSILPSDLWADSRGYANLFALLDITSWVLTGAGATLVATIESAPVISALTDAWLTSYPRPGRRRRDPK